MSKPILRELSQQNQPETSEVHQRDLPIAERRPADVEMTRGAQDEARQHGVGPIQRFDHLLEA